MTVRKWLSVLPGVWLVAFAGAWAQGNTHVRIVRLSFAEGTVTLQRPDLPEWSKAPVNTPLQEGYKLATDQDSFAEVEFENGSTARIGENSLLVFTELSLAPSGGKVNRLTLEHGYGTFHVTPERDDVYEVKVADATLTPQGKAEFRADLGEEALRVEVFKGSVEFAGPRGTVELAKNKVLEYEAGSDEAYNITHGITRDSWDEWASSRDKLSAENRPPSPYSADVGNTYYGWSDLYNYGTWSYFPGIGYGWAPAVGLGWAPYSCGRWVWYPNWGYTWVAAEPWGWLPFHYGTWTFDPVFGWVWIPGGFDTWSPALVTWYQGPGWIGWAPAGAGGSCLMTKGCVTAVTTDVIRTGRPVGPSSVLAVDPTRGQAVRSPSIRPTLMARLPGEMVGVRLPAARGPQVLGPAAPLARTTREGWVRPAPIRSQLPASSTAQSSTPLRNPVHNWPPSEASRVGAAGRMGGTTGAHSAPPVSHGDVFGGSVHRTGGGAIGGGSIAHGGGGVTPHH